jgi:hypothetical protein
MTKYAITKDAVTIREMAAKVVTMAHLGYQGGWYYVDLETWEIYYAEITRAWNPWSDDAVVVPVESCFELDGIDASPCVEWRVAAGSLKSWVEIRAAYAESEDALENNGDLADWVNFADVVRWAEEENEEWAEEISESEGFAQDAAIDLVESCILEFVEA